MKKKTRFNSSQVSLHDLRLVLNAKKTKFMAFSRARSQTQGNTNLCTKNGDSIEKVSSYKYLSIWVDDKLSFKVHIGNLVKKLKLRIGFYFLNKACC